MRVKLIALALCVASINFAAAASNNKTALEALAAKSVSADSEEARAAVALLRAEGPAGLQAFLSRHADELKNRRLDPSGPLSQKADPEWERLRVALDQVCKQKDCYGSRLYWHTDIEQAKAAAAASHKPILSLRLLGNLDEDLSCANSRFFRITLYANQDVSSYLRENFILHWKSVRPVPKVTIDFGDGRKLERTLTGNSIHYVLDSEGRVVDALPGLYGARAFLRELRRAEEVTKQAAGRADKEREDMLIKYHQARIKEIATEMNNAFARVGLIDPGGSATGDDGNKLPTAVQAARMVMTKLGTERSLLRGISGGQKVLEVRPEDVVWFRVAAAHLDDSRLDATSRALMRNKNPEVYASSQRLQYAVETLELMIAADTARNEYLFHERIHQWLVNPVMANDVERLNESVYASLFLTPSSDIWLGLHPTEVYSGIERDGVKN
jgi:hypothetical protein